MPRNPHESDLDTIAAALGPMLNRVVFVGGSTVGFYVNDEAAPPVRGTDDIDCVVELQTTTAYHALDQELQQQGFRHDTSAGAPICRYMFATRVVDIMPTNSEVLGFSNRWYSEGVRTAQSVDLFSGRSVRILSVPYFCASKFEAYDGRGQGDFWGSHDIQDIVAILDGCTEAEVLLSGASGDLAVYLDESFRRVFDVDQQDIQVHLSGDFKGPRADKIKQMITRLYGPSPTAVRPLPGTGS